MNNPASANLIARRLGVLLSVAIMLAVDAGVAWGDPPAWAPAHGKRRKDAAHQGYTGKTWENDFGVLAGRCDRQAVGAVFGAVAGGAIGASVSSDENRPVAVIAGAILGAALGATVARELGQDDRACVAHVIELGRPGVPVTWSGQNGIHYVVTPQPVHREGGRNCRKFVTEARGPSGQPQRSQGVACQAGNGKWEVVS